MSFSRPQQPELRTYITLAWSAHCRAEGREDFRCSSSKRCGACAYCGWYEAVLDKATGHRSTTDCDAGRDYDCFMAALEEIHGQSIKWKMRLFTGDVRRMMHELRKSVGTAALTAAGVDEEYLKRALRHGFGTREPWTVPKADLIVILGEVKRYVRRHKSGQEKELAPAVAEDDSGDLF